MKFLLALVATSCTVTLFWAFSGFGDTTLSGPSTQPDKAIPEASQLVGAFYRALVQAEPPTYEQEEKLFDVSSSPLRSQLVEKGNVPDNQPVLLEFFRKNRDVFMPQGIKNVTGLRGIVISSPFTFLGSPVGLKPGRAGTGCYVVVYFGIDIEAKPRVRSIVFDIRDDGKISPDAIYLGGFEGELTYEKFFDTDYAIRRASTQEADEQ